MNTLLKFLLPLIIMTATLPARAEVDPTFNFIAKAWINPPFKFSMDAIWQGAGLPDRGNNFYVFAAPSSQSFAERYDPLSPRYQAWEGAYVDSAFAFASEWPALRERDIPQSIETVKKLVEADQAAWLFGAGDPAPLARTLTARVVGPDCDGFFLMLSTIETHSDVGDGVSQLPLYPPFSAVSALVTPYDVVLYEASTRFKYDVDRGVFLVAYASNTIWRTIGGRVHGASPEVAFEQLAMLRGTTF